MQAQLAERIGVSTEFVSRMERGRALPSIETLLDLCEVLRCTPDELLLGPAQEGVDALSQRLRAAKPTLAREVLGVAEAMLRYSSDRERDGSKKKRGR